jgi:hypothetical protein
LIPPDVETINKLEGVIRMRIAIGQLSRPLYPFDEGVTFEV